MTWHKDGQILISGDKMGKIFISSVDMAKVSLIDSVTRVVWLELQANCIEYM
jgi:hypothetical protein